MILDPHKMQPGFVETRLCYSYSFYCSLEIQALRQSSTILSPRANKLQSFHAWRNIFPAHAKVCRDLLKCPGPLMAAGVDMTDARTGRVLQVLYAPFSDWKTSGGRFYPAILQPDISAQALERLLAQVRPLPDAEARADLESNLRLRLLEWGVEVVLVRSLSDVAAWFPRGTLRWRGLPGMKPTQWNSSLLREFVPKHIFLANPVREHMEKMHGLPEPEGSMARAANMSALSTIAVRSVLFSSPMVTPPAQLCARLCAAGLIPLTVVEEGHRAQIIAYQSPKWPG